MISHGNSYDTTPQKHRSRTALAALCSLLAATSLVGTGCAASIGGASEDNASGLIFSIDDMDLYYTNRDQDPSYDASASTKITLGAKSKVSGEGATASGSNVTITQAGTYILTGSASDGQVLVECADEDAKVQLVLDGVKLTCKCGPALYVKAADKCFVTLAKGSENTLADTSGYTLASDDGDEEPTAALFSKADLTLQGSGQLTVRGNCNNGIGSKDDLVITGGSYKITAANDGLRGRDCVKVLDGTFKIKSAQDAVKSNNDEDTTRGFVKIDGGTWTIDAGDDAFHAETAFILNDGDVTVTSCYEGYEGVQVYLNGGTTNITASDDAINAASGSSSDAQNGDDRGKSFDHGAASGSDSASSSSSQTPPAKPDGNSASTGSSGGNAEQPPSKPEGTDSGSASSSDGVQPEASQDGGAKGGGEPPQGNGNPGNGGGGMDADTSCLVQINGGDITLDSGGDGIDSNGAIEMTGGNVVVYGPTSGGDGALDYGTTASVSGGKIIALGSKGMAVGFMSGTQPYALVDISGSDGDTVTVSDASGEKIMSTTAAKGFETAVVSCSTMSEGESYTITSGKSSASFTATTGA